MSAGAATGGIANCRTALPPIMRAINGSGAASLAAWQTPKLKHYLAGFPAADALHKAQSDAEAMLRRYRV